jgi:hypothetical protein
MIAEQWVLSSRGLAIPILSLMCSHSGVIFGRANNNKKSIDSGYF